MRIQAKIITQENPVTGAVNVNFVTDPLTTIDDCVVHAGSWKGTPVKVRDCIIEVDDEEVAQLISTTSLRSEANDYTGEGVTEAEMRAMLGDKYHDETDNR